MVTIRESELISGVFIAELETFGDERGQFTETFRQSWFPQRSWERIQCNRSESKAGVLRGLHYHFNQVDYWCVMAGQLRAALVDVRPDSPTFRASDVVPMGGEHRVGLFIPVGVAHGFAALEDTILTYVVDNYYDSSDEYGVAWDDPSLGVDWALARPLLSGRDKANAPLADIPPQQLPHMAHSRLPGPAS